MSCHVMSCILLFSDYSVVGLNNHVRSCFVYNASFILFKQVKNGHTTDCNILEEFCDGKAFTSHPLFSLHHDVLQLFFYLDELEVCNAL